MVLRDLRVAARDSSYSEKLDFDVCSVHGCDYLGSSKGFFGDWSAPAVLQQMMLGSKATVSDGRPPYPGSRCMIAEMEIFLLEVE